MQQLYSILFLLAASQAIFLAVFLLHKHRRLYANRFLAVLMLVYAVILIDMLLQDEGLYVSVPWILLLISGMPMVIGPLHYLYARHLVTPRQHLHRIDWLHFLPFLLYKLSLLPFFFRSSIGLSNFIESLQGPDIPLQFILLNWVINIQALVYLGMVLVLLSNYTRGLTRVFSNIENVRLQWMRNITLLAIVALLFFLLENIAFLFDFRFESSSPLSSLIAPVFVYTVGYLGLLTSEVFTEPEIERSVSEAARMAEEEDLIAEDVPVTEKAENGSSRQDSNGKYQRSGLSLERAGQLAAELEELMETGQPYTDPSLTLNRLAAMLCISTHNLSEVINTRFEQNFFDFVNSYRVEKVKRELSDPKNEAYTVLALAFEAGFNSKSSFNSIFKKHTGSTPSEFRDRAA